MIVLGTMFLVSSSVNASMFIACGWMLSGQFFFFLFLLYGAFGVISEKSLPNLRLWRFTPMFSF